MRSGDEPAPAIFYTLHMTCKGKEMSTPDTELPPLPRPQVPRIDADVDLMDIRRLANWCEKTAKDYARAAIEADRQARGEPVAYRLLRKNADGDWVTDGRLWCDGIPDGDLVRDVAKSGQYRIEYAYAAPQPAEPVKVPIDDLAHEIWAVAQTAPGEGIVDAVERIAALLARGVMGNPQNINDILTMALLEVRQKHGIAAHTIRVEWTGTIDRPAIAITGIEVEGIVNGALAQGQEEI